MVLRVSSALLAAVALVALAGCDMIGGSDNSDAAAGKDAKPLALADATGGGAAPVVAAGPDFGDDNGDFAKDGECDDMRFEGAGMTSTRLLDADIRHDASDCRAAFNQNRLTFKGDNVTSATLASATQGDANRIQWGDDGSSFANDGECDDKRFSGAGMTSTPLLDSDISHDATDCRVAFQQGRLALRQ